MTTRLRRLDIETEEGNRHELITLCGLVSPASWDERGFVSGVCLISENEKYYFLKVRAAELKILDFLKVDVEVTGWIEVQGGVTYLHVVSIAPLARGC